jgi:hypothetical protein
MLDAGPAKDNCDDKNIKHFTDFESIIICKLIESPHYIGRGYLCKNDNSEKYKKNKQICKLIDKIRYKCCSKHAFI